jgi:transcriptional regulator with XRE-family HTH domain
MGSDLPKLSEDDVERAKRLSVSRRMRERMDELGPNARAVSKAIGAGNTYVHDILSGKIKNPDRARLERIARELQCSVEWLEGTVNTLYAPERPIRSDERVQIPVVGFIEPETFRTMKSDPLESRKVDFQVHPQYPNARHFAFDVRGTDMNAARDRGRPAPIVEGMTVVCVDLATAGAPIENGYIYYIEREGSLDGKPACERLLRRAFVRVDHIELVAESTEADRPVFSIPREPGKQGDVKVIGLVYGAFYDFTR